MKRKVFLTGVQLRSAKDELRPALDMQPKSHKRGKYIAAVSKKYNISTSTAWKMLRRLHRSTNGNGKHVTEASPVVASTPEQILGINDQIKVTVEGNGSSSVLTGSYFQVGVMLGRLFGWVTK